jgi:hypothetical protein
LRALAILSSLADFLGPVTTLLGPVAAFLSLVAACLSLWSLRKTRAKMRSLSRPSTSRDGVTGAKDADHPDLSDLLRWFGAYHILEARRRRLLVWFVLGSALFIASTTIMFIATSAPPPRRGPPWTYRELQLPAWRFPDEPPLPSTFAQVPDKLLRRPSTGTLAALAARLQQALAEAGYVGETYLPFDDGFALITPMEGIASDGRPRPDAGRWAVKSPPLFSLHDYLEALLHARHGLYRVWVFTVSTHSYRFGPQDNTPERLRGLYAAGATGLPREIERRLFFDEYHCFALAYEFERLEQPPQPVFVPASNVLADQQLLASGIIGALSR